MLGGQLNSAASTRACDRHIADLGRIINKWDVQGGGFFQSRDKLETVFMHTAAVILVQSIAQ
jgi:hypothetical protein